MKLRNATIALLSTFVLLVPSARAAGEVLVVDLFHYNGSIQNAINAAAEGDTILVKDAFAASAKIHVNGKSLTIVPGSAFSTVNIFKESVVVENLGPSQKVVLRGVQTLFTSPTSTPPGLHGLVLRNNQGEVVIENGSFNASVTPLPTVPLGNGALIENCQSVTFHNCVFNSLSTAENDLGLHEGHGVLAKDSRVVFYNCSLWGVLGKSCPSGSICDGGWGGHGALFQGGTLFASKTRFSGASGGIKGCLGGQCGQDSLAGSGLVMTDSVSAYALDCFFEAGGFGGATVSGGNLTTIPSLARSLNTNSPVFEGNDIVVGFEGQPGDLVFLVYSLTPKSVDYLNYAGVLLPELASSNIMYCGALDGTGTKLVHIPIPFLFLPASVDGINVYAQSASVAVTGELILGAPATVSILRAGL